MCRCDDVDKSISGNLPGKIAQPARTVHGCRDVAGPAVNNFHGYLYSIHHYGVGGLGLLPSEFPVNFHMLRQCCFTCPAYKWRLFASVNQLHIVTGRRTLPPPLVHVFRSHIRRGDAELIVQLVAGDALKMRAHARLPRTALPRPVLPEKVGS